MAAGSETGYEESDGAANLQPTDVGRFRDALA